MENLQLFFTEYKHIIIIVHVFAVVVGMGGALISDVLFNKYLSDGKINPTENSTLFTLTRIIWMSLGLIILSGFCMFLSDPLKYSESAKFLIKMIVVATLTLNGILFWKITHRGLRKINFRDNNFQHKYVRIRKFSFAFGGISIVSWLSAFVLGSIKSIPIHLHQALFIYIGLLLIGIICSQILEYYIVHKKKLNLFR